MSSGAGTSESAASAGCSLSESIRFRPRSNSNNNSNNNSNQNSNDKEIAAFLKDFDVATKTEEISELLKSDAALQTTFSMLTDSVTYADFWTRYFYRIDNPERLPETYSFYYQKYLQEEQEEEDSEPAPRATMGGFTSFLGGVVSKLTHESDTDYADTSGMVDESMEQQTDNEDGAVAAARSALGFLTGASGRPPFVMNTAISDDDEDDDDDEIQQSSPEDDDDSEVELGWDDDDDEDFDGLDDDDDEEEINTDEIAFEDGDDRSETVDFKDAEKEGLLEELEQAKEERDVLQKTVQMQAEELKKFAQNSTALSPRAAAVDSGDASTEGLKLQLFEKDAELAALRSKLEDRHDDDEHDATSELQTQLESLQQALKTKDHDFEELKKATQAQTKALEQKLQEQSTQNEELEELREKLSTRDREFEQLETQNESEASKLKQKLQEKQAEKEEMTLALQSQIYALKRQLEEGGDSEETLADELRTTLASAQAENSRLHRKVETAISENENLQSQLVVKTTEAETAISQTQQLENTVADLQSQLATKTQEAEKASGSATENQTMFAQLQAEIADKESIQKSLETKLQGLQNDLSNLRDEGEQKLQAAADQHAATTSGLETQLLSLTNDLEASKKETLLANQKAELMRNELDQLRASLERPTSPGSSSTGVRVDVPQDAMETAAEAKAPPAIPSTPNAAVSLGLEPSENDGDDDDDGWGDDW
mmetsp:Transcript_18777/g.46617  ORF Transcript_18777/g.46617 Transcript_18777/m.46617 type:complete len:717 (+) Transcript_18777:316-2466(+)